MAQAQNDPVYQAGDHVVVYESGQIAAHAEAGHLANDGHPRPATIIREHPNEPGTLEVQYSDEGEPSSELITDQQRLRPAAK